MQPLRRWMPAPGHPDTLWANALPHDLAAAKNLAFCAEFAAHGGEAHSPGGVRGEAELVRMQQAELLDLERDPAPPCSVIAVRLSAGTRRVLAGSGPVPPAQQQASQRTANAATTDQTQRRNEFRVARAVAGAAVKAEIAAWVTQGDPGGPRGLEQCMMARINEFPAPFSP